MENIYKVPLPFEKLMISQLAKNKTLTNASKQELRDENYEDYWG
jgi:hypothetical protein